MRKLWLITLASVLVALLGIGAGRPIQPVAFQEVQMAVFSLQALHDEIENDPLALGYKNGDGTWKGDAVIADLINAANYKIDRTSVQMEAVRAAVTYGAYNRLGLDEQEWIVWMTPNSGEFQVTADMKLQLSGRTLTSSGSAGTGADGDSFWAVADDQDMAPAMLALIEIDGSRAEVLWEEGKTVSISEVAHAANL